MKIIYLLILIGSFSAIGFAQASSGFCITVTDEVGAYVPNAKVKLTPTRQSKSQTKYEFVTGEDKGLDVKVLEGIYDISIRANNYKKVVLKNQLLPYDPRGCIGIKLKSTVPPHQIT